MASDWKTKRRIAAHVLFAPGFFDALAGRFLCETRTQNAPTPAPPAWDELRGALHVHTCTYSDGAGTVEEVMDAAREADVDFVLLTDHNTVRPLKDGWPDRYAEKPPYLLVGDEITVQSGAFLLALDLPPDFEFPVERPSQEAIDAVRSAGGLPLVSLPFDMKHPWEDWHTVGCEGIEVLNLSTIAREHINIPSLLWLLPIWKTRGPMAVLRAIATRPDGALARWDRHLAAGQRWIGLGSLDAHALMKIGKKKHPIPSYADSFRAATTHVLIEPGRADVPTAIAEALRAGRCYFAYDCLGDPHGLRFWADSGATFSQEAPVGATLHARATPKTLLRLYRDGRLIAAGKDGALTFRADIAGAYRVEAYRIGAWCGPFALGARPWAFTNPIYVA